MADDDNELTERTVTIHGIEHTMLLNDEDAERYEAQEAAWQAAQDAAQGGEESTTDEQASTKAKTPDNKSKSAQGK